MTFTKTSSFIGIVLLALISLAFSTNYNVENATEKKQYTEDEMLSGSAGTKARSVDGAFSKDKSIKKDSNWIELFNGKNLDGWKANLGENGGDETSDPIEDIFTVENGVIKVYPKAPANSKQYNACLRYTDKVFSKFHLQVEYRWLTKKFQPRTEVSRDAGILFHCHTKIDNVWPPSIEMQMGDGKPGKKYVSGDLFVLHNSRADTPVVDKKYNANGTLIPKGIGSEFRGKSATPFYAENPLQEWNKAELIVQGSEKAEFYLNGVLMNEVYNMQYKNEEGEFLPLEQGYIAVQAEWAELEYKTIRIKEIVD